MERSILRRSEGSFRGRDDLRLFRRSWVPSDPARLLVLVHGYAEHSGRYDHVGSWFAGRGYAVHAYDHRGHGRSDGLRCHVARFDELLDDLGLFLDRIQREHPGLPVVILGHSMGGLVVSSFLVERQPRVQGAVVSGVPLAVSNNVSRARVGLVALLRRLLPRFYLASGLDVNGLSRDPEVVRRYVEDPLVHRRMTLSFASELLAAVARTAAAAPRVRVPLLLLHGESDPLCPVEGSRAFHADLTAPRSGFRAYPNLCHEILNEPEQEQVFQDLFDWVRALPPTAAP